MTPPKPTHVRVDVVVCSKGDLDLDTRREIACECECTAEVFTTFLELAEQGVRVLYIDSHTCIRHHYVVDELHHCPSN